MHDTIYSRSLRPLTALVAIASFASLGPPATAQDIDRVEVTNLPKVQTIEGSVEVAGPIAQTRLLMQSEQVVSPVEPSDTTHLVPAGILETAGFGSAVLSLTGTVRAAFYRPGRIGAILIPDIEPARTAFLEEGQLLFPLEVEAEADAERGIYFTSNQPLSTLGFPRYRVYFYNTTDRPATVTLYAYLAN